MPMQNRPPSGYSSIVSCIIHLAAAAVTMSASAVENVCIKESNQYGAPGLAPKLRSHPIGHPTPMSILLAEIGETIEAQQVVDIVRRADEAIMDVYGNPDQSTWNITRKDGTQDGNEPLTDADLRANTVRISPECGRKYEGLLFASFFMQGLPKTCQYCCGLLTSYMEDLLVICEGLAMLAGGKVPVISEENKMSSWEQRRHYKYCWMVDPLDGTKEFIKRNGEFTVNVALCRDGLPIFGVVSAPVRRTVWFAAEAQGAYKQVASSGIHVDLPAQPHTHSSSRCRFAHILRPGYALCGNRMGKSLPCGDNRICRHHLKSPPFLHYPERSAFMLRATGPK
eukprot:GHVT01001409.1.p1 GENE.GHVT01001409.1~~GHVT01001409.1.p1  ORF type:complete len:339 (-),score=21.52 GHVT01001409.1:1381-2397(-)